MNRLTMLAAAFFALSGASSVCGQDADEVKRLKEQVDSLRAKLEAADQTIKKLQEENGRLRAAGAKRFELKGAYGTLTYAGTVTRTDTGKEYEYLIEELKLTFDPARKSLGKLSNSVDEIVVKEVHLVATKKPAEGKGPYTVLSRDNKPTTLVLTKAAPTATLEKVKVVVTKEVYDQADHVGLAITNGKLLWPIGGELKAEIKK